MLVCNNLKHFVKESEYALQTIPISASSEKKKKDQLPRTVKEKKAYSKCLFTVCSKYILESQHKTGKKKIKQILPNKTT